LLVDGRILIQILEAQKHADPMDPNLSSSSDFAVTIEELVNHMQSRLCRIVIHLFEKDLFQEMLEWLAEAEEEDRRRAQDFSQVASI
jgi:hypothetical protein